MKTLEWLIHILPCSWRCFRIPRTTLFITKAWFCFVCFTVKTSQFYFLCAFLPCRSFLNINIYVIQVKLVTTFVLQCLHFHFWLSQNKMYIFTYLLTKQNRVFTRSCFLKKECLLSFRDTCNELTLAKSKA